MSFLQGLVNSILLPVMAIALVMLILKLNIDPAGPPLNLSFEIYSLLPPEGGSNSKEVIIPHDTIIPVAGAAPPEFVSVLGGSQFIKGKRHDGINNSLQLSQWLLNTFWHTPPYYGKAPNPILLVCFSINYYHHIWEEPNKRKNVEKT